MAPQSVIASRFGLRYTRGMMRGEHCVLCSRKDIFRINGATHLAGFSMIELLITVLIILILTTLYWSPNRASRQKGIQLACQKNLQKNYIALQIYANDSGGKFPHLASARSSGEVLDLLVPKYTSDTSTFICPGSKDALLPAGASLRAFRVSYAYYMGLEITNSQPLMSDKQINTLAKPAGGQAFSITGKPPGNNHRRYGGNFLFCDGHVELTPPQVPFALELEKGEVLLNP